MHIIAYVLAAGLYAAASARYAAWFSQARPGTPGLGRVLMRLGGIGHLGGAALYWTRFGEPPLVGLGPSLATISFLVVLALIVIDFMVDARAVGLILAPLAAFLLVMAIVVGLAPTGAAVSYRGPWLALHTSFSFLGYAGWMVAASAGVMYLAQFRELKQKHLGAVFQFFPPLETLDRLSQRALFGGFLALTLGILVGWVWTVRFHRELGWSDPKILWGVLTWVVLGLIVWTRLSGRATRRQAAVWNLAGFAMVVVAYVLMKIVAPGSRLFL